MRPMCSLTPNLDIEEPIYEYNDDDGRKSGGAGRQEEEQ